MKKFLNVVCTKCYKNFNYLYIGGPKRKRCSNCKPKKERPSFNAYDFDWGPLRPSWHLTKQKRNAGRWFGKQFGVVYRQAGFFMFWRPRQKPIKSNIVTTSENVPKALIWAEQGMRNIQSEVTSGD